MLLVEIDTENAIASLRPDSALSRADFESAAETIDTYLESADSLNGLMVCTRDFPGWDSFGALIKHLKFVRAHHHRIARVALVTDSRAADYAERLARHFVAATVRHFPFDAEHEARDWILEASDRATPAMRQS
jgi:hypothetical protein